MATLPDDILRHIFSFLPQNTVLDCRLLSRASGYLATSLAFRHIRLEILCDPLSFLRISESSQLRLLVREITIDAGHGLLPNEERAQVVLRIARFLLTLPRLGLFSALQSVSIKFKPHYVDSVGRDGRALDDPSQYQSFQTRVLGVIIDCINGQWTEERHQSWGRLWKAWSEKRTSLYTFTGESTSVSGDHFANFRAPFSPGGRLVSLSFLAIANLNDGLQDVIYKAPEFQRLISSQTLEVLKLLVDTRRKSINTSEQIFFPETYDFFEQLPVTWLSPHIASNLRILSLYCRGYFGWAPKLDFRVLNPGGGISAFPNLRILALGNYVFTHDWQIDWITSLGAENGRGGLEELYLDDCPIMWRAHVPGPMDESISDLNGVKLENSGYPLKEVMTRTDPQNGNSDMVTVDFGLRWSTVLHTWHDKMKALKVFRMGSGDWDEQHTVTVATARTMDLTGTVERRMAMQPVWKRRCEDVVHLNYDRPSLAECLEKDNSSYAIGHGIGLDQRREYVLQYVKFHVGVGWVERDFKEDIMNQYENGWHLYEASRSADEEAFRGLSEAVAFRSRACK